MRILHIEYGFDYPPPGGEQKRTFEECRRLAQTDELLLAYSSFCADWRNTEKEFDPEQIPFKTLGVNINQEIYIGGILTINWSTNYTNYTNKKRILVVKIVCSNAINRVATRSHITYPKSGIPD